MGKTVLCSSSRRFVSLFADFIQGLLKKNEENLSRSFNFTLHYIDDALPLNNSRLGDCIDRIYPLALEINDTTNTDKSASYLDLRIDIYSEGWLRTKLNDKRDDFNIHIVSFPFICSNIPAWSIYISANTIFQSLWFLSVYT
jgi:hypothetical protein